MTRLGKISRTIAIIAGCKIEIVILFPEDKDIINKFIKKSNGDNIIYLNYNLLSIIGFTIPSTDSDNKYITLTEFRKTQLVSLMEKSLKLLSKGEMFYRDDSNRLCIYNDKENNIKNQIGDIIVAIKPTIVYDKKNDVDYEGCRLFINKTTSYVDLTTMELFSIYNLLNKIDIFLYSQSLFNSIVEKFRQRSDNENKELEEVESKLDALIDLNTREG